METSTPPPHTLAIPDFLKPADDSDEDAGVSHWEMFVGPPLSEAVLDFAASYGIDHNIAFGTIMAVFSQALGRSIAIELPDRLVTAPFNLLILTPEPAPLWTTAPLRFHRLELGDFILNRTWKQNPLNENPSPQAYEKHQSAVFRIASRIYREDLRPPFKPGMPDRHVMVGTPKRGLIEKLRNLSPSQLLELQEAFDDDSDWLWRQGSNPHAMASFFWQLSTAQAALFFQRHPWVGRIPFLLLRTEEPGYPQLQNDLACLETFRGFHQRILTKRQARKGEMVRRRIPAPSLKPYMALLYRGQRELGSSRLPFYVPTPSMVVDLGLKFCLTLMALQDVVELHPRDIANCLETAKRYLCTHLNNLSAYQQLLAAEGAELAGLTRREREAYRKILEAGRLTAAKLRKTFHQMSAAERDDIVLNLLDRGLIRKEGDYLTRTAA